MAECCLYLFGTLPLAYQEDCLAVLGATIKALKSVSEVKTEALQAIYDEWYRVVEGKKADHAFGEVYR